MVRPSTRKALAELGLHVCREQPSCGGAVVDPREHARWHERVYIAAERLDRDRADAPKPSAVERIEGSSLGRGPRYVGQDDDDLG